MLVLLLYSVDSATSGCTYLQFSLLDCFDLCQLTFSFYINYGNMSGQPGISTGTPWDFDPAAVSDQALDTVRQVVLIL